MSSWTKRKRLESIINGKLADRPPISAWRHFPEQENNPKDLAKVLIEFQRKYDWDFMKINPKAVYYHEAWGNEYDYSVYKDVVPTMIKHVIHDAEDLKKINELPGNEGVFAEQLETIKLIKQEMRDEVPLFMTIFCPIGVLLNLCGERSLGRYRKANREDSLLIKLLEKDREGVHKALAAISRTLARYAAATIKAGTDGVFYAALGMAREGWMTYKEWEEFVKPYDLIVLEELKSSLTILHTCGIYGNPQRFIDYPINVIHWAQSAPGNPPILGSEKWIGDKIPMGGVDERLFGQNKSMEIKRRALKQLEVNYDIPFILAPDCSVSINTLDEELRAFRDSVDIYYKE